jgi:diketogulonate reductase-like aldo/keto reductase
MKMVRREFNRLCVAGIGAITAARSPTSALAGTTSKSRVRTVKLPNGRAVPALGQGAMRLGEGARAEAVEEEALRTGLSLGMTVIDTAELYGNGRSEEFIGHVIAGGRDRVFLVSKVLPKHATRDGIARSCEASLSRLGTNHLDLYLLHWRDQDTDLPSVVAEFENLRAGGKIRAWGVSNFSVRDMEDLFQIREGNRCATNQVRYNLDSRGIEHDLLPWCERRGIPVMAYAPLGESGLVRDPTLARIGAAHDCSAAAVALAWTIRSGNVIAIPASGLAAHVKENAVALSLTLTRQELLTLDATHPLLPTARL